MNPVTKYIWRAAGLLSVGMAYVGVLVPGIPTTSFLLLALWCFSKGSPKLRQWIWDHPTFGVYVQNWTNKRIYPTRAKYIMLVCILISFAWIIYLQLKPVAIVGIGLFMLFWLVWAWRYPGSVEEYDRRVSEGRKIGWLK